MTRRTLVFSVLLLGGFPMGFYWSVGTSSVRLLTESWFNL
ncbi:MAG: hypothetical protein QOJ64_4003 [Acidobacteriota bacterium]|jgi:hypothetical protein|nr:hypothetical protein [Acidobacteriota bacterium]